jgi:hypothetical protein
MFIEKPSDKASIGNRKLVCGVGVNDSNYITSYTIEGKKLRCPFYERWKNILTRCYSSAHHKMHPSYINCSICNEWLSFSNFKAWMIKQDWQNKEIDKDIKISGNKIYSPSACMFIDSKVNKLLCDSASNRGNYPIGVSFNKKAKKYRSYCYADGKQVHLGLYSSVKEASNVYLKFKSKKVLDVSKLYEGELSDCLVRISREITGRIK